MSKRKYDIKHIRCNMSDFHADRHRFRMFYNNKEHIVSCYCGFDVVFDEDTERELTEDVLIEVTNIVIDKIKKDEMKWSYPKEAYKIADVYCVEEFCN